MSDTLVILFGATMLYISVASMLNSFIKALIFQGLLLFVIAILNTTHVNLIGYILVALETIIFKATLIPWFLSKTIKENEIVREVEPYLSNFYSLLIVSLIFGFGFFLALWSMKEGHNLMPLQFGVSMSTILTGLFVIVTRKKLITHIMGYMIVENGIFLLSLSAAKEMPAIVTIGVTLDIFMGILIAGVFINRIKSSFEDQSADELSNLKD